MKSSNKIWAVVLLVLWGLLCLQWFRMKYYFTALSFLYVVIALCLSGTWLYAPWKWRAPIWMQSLWLLVGILIPFVGWIGLREISVSTPFSNILNTLFVLAGMVLLGMGIRSTLIGRNAQSQNESRPVS